MWWQGRMLGFDLETTATDPEDARIVTAALALCGGGLPTQTQTWLADPGVEIPDEAAEVHGITTAIARADGRPAADVVAELVEHLLEARAVGTPIVVFNARYDFTVLDREARRHGVEKWPDSMLGIRVIDPLVIDKWLHRFRKGSRKLDAICEHYGATLTDAHTADADAIAAARAAWVLGAKGVVTREPRTWGGHYQRDVAERTELEAEWESVRHDLDLLHAAQVVWAREQALGLADYFREQRGKGVEDAGDPDEVRVEWPFVPFEAEELAA